MTQGTQTNWGGIDYPMVAGDWYWKSWIGLDSGDHPPILPDSTRVVERLGLGAGAAREIFTALAEDARSYKHPSREARREEVEIAYLKRLAERTDRAARNRDARVKRIIDRELAKKVAAENRRQKRREARKAGLPDPYANQALWAPTPGIRIPVERKEVRYHKTLPPPVTTADQHAYTMVKHNMVSNETARLIGKPVHPGPEYAAMAYDFYPSYISAIPTFDANDQLELIAQLGENVRGGHGFVGNTAAAEMPNTVRLIHDTAVRLVKAYHHARQGDWTGTARSLLEGTTRAPLPPRKSGHWGQVREDANTMSARLLEFRYGVEPLMMDAHAAAQALAYDLNTKPPRTSSRVRKSKRATAEWATTWSMGDGLGRASGYWQSVARRQIVAHFSGNQLPAGEYLGLTDPGSMLQGGWEALPWSFVYDWFVPIGDYLAANAATIIIPQGTYVSTDSAWSYCGAPTGDYSTPPQGSREYISVVRTVSAGLSVPPPELKPFAESASGRHLQSAVALVTQAFTGVTTRIR